MKYYKNKTTGEIIGIQNMREVIDMPTEQSTRLGYKGYSYHIVYDMVCPNKLLGNGITSFCVSHSFLTANYKRIKKEIALSKYPEFKQYSYSDFQKESEISGEDTLNIIQAQTF